jgi:hypothetical protein
VTRRLEKLYEEWSRFWFDSFDPERWALFRLFSGLVIFGFYAIRQADLVEFYTAHRGFPLEALQEFFRMASRWSVLGAFRSATAMLAAHTVFLALLLMQALGRGGRAAAALTFALHVSFVRANLAAIYGVDTISTFFLFSNILVGNGKSRVGLSETLQSVGMRLVQVQICLIYGFSGLGKLKGVSWWNGEALWGVLANPQLSRFDFGWTAHFPVAISFLTSATVYWEIYFPALIWLPRLRPWILLWGVALHLGIGVMMNLPFFALIMVSSYVLFLTAPEKRFAIRGLAAAAARLGVRLLKA